MLVESGYHSDQIGECEKSQFYVPAIRFIFSSTLPRAQKRHEKNASDLQKNQVAFRS